VLQEVLVVDMGCGTLDCTALGVADGACTVRATAGAVGCGGRRIDELLLDHALAAMGVVVLPAGAEARRLATCIDVPEPARGKLLAVCRVCKEAFSSLPEEEGGNVEVVFPTATFLTLGAAAAARFAVAQRSLSETIYTPLTDASIPTALRCAVSPRAFDALCAPVSAVVDGTVRRTVQQWRAAVAAVAATSTSSSSSSSAAAVDEVVLVGGSSRARPVRRAVRRALVAEGFAAFHRPEAYLYCPDDCAAAAAAAAAAHAIALPVAIAGVSTADAEAPGEFCTSVDADEAVALGLAARGAVLGGRVGEGRLRDLLMMDALPTSIGVLCWDAASADAAPALVGTSGTAAAAMAGRGQRIFEPVLGKGARLPCAARRAFTVAAAAHPSAPRLVSLDVYEVRHA
jgi:molecular chaperone DnaK (HSP70)